MTPERMQEAGDEAALRAAPLPPGWDEAVRLEEDPATIPDPAEVDVPGDLRAEIEAHMAKYPDRHSASLPALAAAQRHHGWCSPEAVRQVATVMQVTPAYLSSVVTFYDMLRAEPVGSRYVYVCTSVACHVRNAKAVYDAIWEEARDQGLQNVELREFECLGACDMAPMASVDGRYVGPLREDDAPEIVSALKEGRQALPGRSLEDPGYKLPWEDGAPPEEREPERPEEPVAEPRGEPVHPDVAPAGGTVKEPEEVPPGREPEPVPGAPQPGEPGGVHAAGEAEEQAGEAEEQAGEAEEPAEQAEPPGEQPEAPAEQVEEEEEQREFSLGPWDPERHRKEQE